MFPDLSPRARRVRSWNASGAPVRCINGYLSHRFAADSGFSASSRLRLCAFTLLLIGDLALPRTSRALTPCTSDPAVNQTIFEGVSVNFVGSAAGAFHYRVALETNTGISGGTGLQLHYGADAEGNGGAPFVAFTANAFQTHYETGTGVYGSIPIAQTSGDTITLLGIFSFGVGGVCRDKTFTIPVGVAAATERCDGLDNDNNGTVDDIGGVPGSCPALTPLLVCETTLDCPRPKENACAGSTNGAFFPCTGGSFDTRFGFEQRRLDLFSVSTPGLPLEAALLYNNRNETASPVPGRWFTNYDAGLSAGVDGPKTFADVRWPDGSRGRYVQNTACAGGVCRFDGVLSDGSFLNQNLSGSQTASWDLFYKNGRIYHFSAPGILEEVRDGKGNVLTVTHGDAQNPVRVTGVSDNYGRAVSFTYAASGADAGRLVQVTDPAGRAYDLAYANFQLARVTLPAPNAGDPSPTYVLTYADISGFDQGGYRDNLTEIEFRRDGDNPDPSNDRVVGKWSFDNQSRVEEEEGPGGALGRTVAYNAASTVVTDSRGNATTYGFDFTSGLTLTTTVPCASCGGGTASSTLVRNAQGQITSRTDFRGTETTWANHDANGDPGVVTEALGDPEQRTAIITYHPELHTPLSIVRPSVVPGGTNKVTIIDYQKPSSSPPADPPLNPPADLDPASFNIPGTNNTNFDRVVNRVIESGWTRDAAGVPVRVAYVTHFTYDSLGRVTNIDGPRSSTPNDDTDFAYYADSAGQGNKRGQLQSVTNAASQITIFNDYDALGNVLSVTDPNGLTTSFTYDAASRVRTITQVGAGPGGANLLTEYVYEANGNLDYIRLPRGNFINYQYDAGSRLASITRTATQPASPQATPAGETIVYSYDAEGNRTREEVRPDVGAGAARFTEFEYDALNRLEKVYNPAFGALPAAPVFRASTYDANGNRTGLDLFKDAGATGLRHTAFAFDPLSRLSQVTQDDGSPGGVVTGYAYDTQDNLATLTDGIAHDTDYTTDDFGRQVEVVSPDTGTTQFEYDEAGNLIEKRQNGLVTQYTYDALNRLLSVSFPSNPAENLAYVYDSRPDGPPLTNGVGRLVKLTDASGATFFSYDKRGNVTLEARAQGGVTLTTAYTWEENGNLATLTYPSGRVLTYAYALPNDQPTQVEMSFAGANTTLASAIAFAPFGPLASLQYGNGLLETRTYDAAGQLDLLSVAPAAGPAVLSLDYTFDETGNITRIDDQLDALKSKIYEPEGYDKLDRLIKATIGGLGTFQYTYDAVGNRTEENHDGAITTYNIVSTNNQIDTLSGATTADFEYDDHGNTTTDGTLTFTYHPTHQLKEATDQTPTVLGSYEYDGQSRRTAKTVNGLTRLFAYDTGAQMLGEYDDAGDVLKEYAYLGTQRLVMVDHDQDDEGVRDEADNCRIVANPTQTDTDTDTLGDACDAAPSNPDRDGDGLLDGQEDADKDGQVSAGETDPDNPDTDGDTFSDGEELSAGTDPLSPNSYPGAPSAIPALSVMGVVIFLVLFAMGRFWAIRRRWWKVGRGMDLMVLALGLTLMAPEAVTPQGGGAPERVLYIHMDHLGTAQKLTDVAQQVVWEAQAEAFGKTTVTAQSTVFNLRFPGQYEDRETGLFYNYLRTHNTATGQYLQPDPLGVVTGANVYAYVDGNPLRRVDPTGEIFTPDTLLDAGFIAYDLYRLFADNILGRCDNLSTNLSALGADSMAFLVPAVTGAGLGLRAAAKAAQAELRASKTAAALQRAERATDIASLTKGPGPTTSLVAARGAPQVGDKVFRAFGADSRGLGQSWSRTNPHSVSNFRNAAGLPSRRGITGYAGADEGFNSGGFVAEGRILDTKGVTVTPGGATSLHGNIGGIDELKFTDPANQILLERVYGVNPPF